MSSHDTLASLGVRSEKFSGRTGNRYWWYKLKDGDYIPPIFRMLSEREWAVLEAWFSDTDSRFASPGEVSVPGVSFLAGLIGGNGLNRIVQCGHYAGYSTLLLGFLLRSMGKRRSLFSVDIDPAMTAYTDFWIEKAGLTDVVKTVVMDSADVAAPNAASEWLCDSPQVVFIDSSHQYLHTVKELDCWYDVLTPSGLMLLHDVSIYAQGFDSTREGGVLRATQEWCTRRGVQPMLINSFVDGSNDLNSLVYKDGCGMGIIQKAGSEKV